MYNRWRFNINLLAKPNNNGLNFISTMLNYNLKPSITEPTRMTNSSQTLIDHIWSSLNQDFVAFVITEPISDHYPVLTLWKIDTNFNPKKVKLRSRDPKLFEKFGKDFKDFMVDSDYANIHCPVSLINELINHLKDNCSRNFEQKEVCLKKAALRCPWIDKDLANCIKKKYQIFEIYKKNLVPYETFTRYRNLLSKTIVMARKLYNLKKFNELERDPKKSLASN